MPPINAELPVEWVTKEIIRQMFNDEHIIQRADSGELIKQITRSSHLDNPPNKEPYCTHSQIIRYYSLDGEPLAVAHQYLRPDGTLGASGKPDPKRLYLPDRVIAVRSSE
mgnify:CR=1 FL=1|jgi:hypothetical protein